jgi:hypothetical protein
MRPLLNGGARPDRVGGARSALYVVALICIYENPQARDLYEEEKLLAKKSVR